VDGANQLWKLSTIESIAAPPRHGESHARRAAWSAHAHAYVPAARAITEPDTWISLRDAGTGRVEEYRVKHVKKKEVYTYSVMRTAT